MFEYWRVRNPEIRRFFGGEYKSRVAMLEEEPTEAVAADAELTIESDNVEDGDTVTIGDIVYTFKDSFENDGEPYQVKVGTDNDESAENLKKAINKDGTEGTEYGKGTEAHPYVEADTDEADNIVTVTAKTKGEVANEITVDEDMDNGEWDEDTLTGGVDGTVANKGEVRFDEDNLYIAVDDCTVSDSNWKKTSLSSL